MEKKKYQKLLEKYLYIYVVFRWISENIVLCLILNHFNILNSFTGFIALLITVFSSILCETNTNILIKMEKTNEQSK